MILYIIRGVPGSGKTTLGNKLAPEYNFAADDYFKNIKWSPKLLEEAHRDCQNNVEMAMMTGIETVAVSNTFIHQWEIEPYRKMAEKYNYDIIEIIMKSNFKSIHNVPMEKVVKMKKEFEY